eukprot:UN31399
MGGCLRGKTKSRNSFQTIDENEPIVRKPDYDVVCVQNKTDETIIRESGSIRGFEFILENSTGCQVFVVDHLAQVTIENCNNCQIFLGPCTGSVFIRNSKNCVIGSITRQLRCRDCKDIYLYLCCHTEPVVESSNKLMFGCLQWNYFNLAKHMEKAELTPFINEWHNVHVFDKKRSSYE